MAALDARKWRGDRPIVPFLALAVGFGMVFALATPLFWPPDETTHFFRAYQLSRGEVLPTRHDGAVGAWVPATIARDVRLNGYARNPALRAALLETPASGPRQFAVFPNTAIYPPVAYLPYVVVLTAARPFGLSTWLTVYLCRIAGLAAFIGLVVWALLLLGDGGGWLIVAAASIPTVLFQAAAVSADGITAALVAVTAAITHRALRGASGRLAPTAVVVAVALGLAKPGYWPAALLFLLPAAAARGSERRWWLAAPVAAVGAAGAWALATRSYFQPYEGLADPHRLVRPSSQWHRIATHPLGFAGVLWRTVDTAPWTMVRVAAGEFGLVARHLPVVVVVELLVVLAAIAITRGDRASVRERAAYGGAALLVALATLTAVYVYNSAVGDRIVQDYSGRYLAPVVVLLLFALARPSVALARPSRYRRLPQRAMVIGLAVPLVVSSVLIFQSRATVHAVFGQRRATPSISATDVASQLPAATAPAPSK